MQVRTCMLVKLKQSGQNTQEAEEACKTERDIEREREGAGSRKQEGLRVQGTSASFGGKRVMHVQAGTGIGRQGQARKRHKSQLSR